MTRHLSGCKDPNQPKTSAPVPSLHLLVEGGFPKMYWLHLAVPTNAPLSMLDQFLRRIWLECCGHMSAFKMEGRRYAAVPMSEEFGSDFHEESMEVPAGRVLRVGTKFSHEYDYGSTTELSLKVLGVLETSGKPKEIQLLARNDDPQILCSKCDAPAVQVCSQCIWQGGGWLCDTCAEDHECGEEMFLPVVNSPRVGVCGYTG